MKKLRNSYTVKLSSFESVIHHLEGLRFSNEILNTNKITITRSKKNRYLKWIVTEKYVHEEETQ